MRIELPLASIALTEGSNGSTRTADGMELECVQLQSSAAAAAEADADWSGLACVLRSALWHAGNPTAVCACTILAPTAVRRRVAGASAPRPQARAVAAPLDTPSICGEGLPGLACVAVACGTTVGALTLAVGMAYAYARRKRSASELICAADGPALPASALACARHRHGHRAISAQAATDAPEPRGLHPPLAASPTGCAGGVSDQAESPPPSEPTRTGTHAVPRPSSAPAEPRAQQRIVGASERDRLPTREPARLRLPSNRVAPVGAHGQVGSADGLALPQSHARLAETKRELLLSSTAPGVPAVTPLYSTVPTRTPLPPIGSQVLPKRRRHKRAAGGEGVSAKAHTPSPQVAEHGTAAVEIGTRVCSGRECGARVTDAETDGVAEGRTDGRVPTHGQRRASVDGVVCTDGALAVAEALSQRCRAPVCADPALSTLRRERPQSALAAAGGRVYTARALPPPRPASAGASMRLSVQGRSPERGCEASVQPSAALPPAGQRRNRPSSAISVCVRL